MGRVFQENDNSQPMQKWWNDVKPSLKLANHLIATPATELARLKDIDRCIVSLQTQFDRLYSRRYPVSAKPIRSHVLGMLVNLIATLQHQRLGNVDERNVLMDIAVVEKSMLDGCLLEFELAS